MQPMPAGHRQQLDHRLGPVAPPVRSRHRARADLCSEPSEQPDPQVRAHAPILRGGRPWERGRNAAGTRAPDHGATPIAGMSQHVTARRSNMTVMTNSALMSTQELAARLDEPNLRVLEVDEDTEAFARLMDRLGITADTRVVLYGGNSNWFAAYAYWYFTYYGHPKVSLLNGGRKSWELEQRPLTTDVATTTPASGYRVAGTRDEIRARRDQIAQALG